MPWRSLIALGSFLVALIAGGPGMTSAQESSEWSFVLTPQIWLSHISNNGFATSATSATFGIFVQAPAGSSTDLKLRSESDPASPVDAQWGLQFAGQKGPWTVAGSMQYAGFTTNNDYFLTSRVLFLNQLSPNQFLIGNFPSGTNFIQEKVETDRYDFDLATSYFFPGVVSDMVDVSVGIGSKFIYAVADRKIRGSQSLQLNQCGATLASCQPVQPVPIPKLYLTCKEDDCSDAKGESTVKSRSYMYGITFPTSTAFHLSQDKKWLLPLNVTPFIGAETRDDNDVVYATRPDASAPHGVTVKRLDGTTFAYGVTADALVRYVSDIGLSAYLGMRVQYLEGHDKFLAWGPLVGLSLRFGGS